MTPTDPTTSPTDPDTDDDVTPDMERVDALAATWVSLNGGSLESAGLVGALLLIADRLADLTDAMAGRP